jgi:creatinine amidohydrolase
MTGTVDTGRVGSEGLAGVGRRKRFGVQSRGMEGTDMPSKGARSKERLPVQWDELTSSDFPEAVKRAKGVCVLPIGVIEKHGPHLPLGTDVMAARAAAVGAAEREYAVVFPSYYFGQIYEAKHQPGCVAIRPELLMELLQGVCDEIGRNGFGKILIVNGHGGNTNWLRFFCQAQLARRSDHVVYMSTRSSDAETEKQIEALRKTQHGGHADEVETSRMMAIRPELVKLDQAGEESGKRRGRLKGLEDAFTGIFWYADYPEHYAGDGRPATTELGEVALEGWVRHLVEVLRAVKRDKSARRLQAEFLRLAEAPTTGQRPSGRRERGS